MTQAHRQHIHHSWNAKVQAVTLTFLCRPPNTPPNASSICVATPHLECSLDSWPVRSSSTHLCTHLSPCSHCSMCSGHTHQTPTPPGCLPCCPHPQAPLAGLPAPLGTTTSQLRGPADRPPWDSVPLAPCTSYFIVSTCSEIILFINWPSCLLIGISEYKLLEGRHLVFSAHFVFPAPGLVHSRHSVNIH